jgi:hypothetical protein
MCTDDEPLRLPKVNRRRFLGYAAGVAAMAVVRAEWPRSVAAAGPMVVGADGSLQVGMAMHIHSSFSEQYGSMDSHLLQAQANAVDVLWWTEHDYRMSGIGYRDTVHFTSLTAEKPAPGEGGPWQWQLQRAGELTKTSTGGIVSSPSSPLDPVVGGSLAVSAESSNHAAASLGFYAQSQSSDWNYHCSLIGQTLAIEVLPTSIGSSAYLEILITSSYHPANSGRPAGQYSISYRLGGPGVPGTSSVSGIQGVVNLAATPSQWNSVAIGPANDIAALWPGMDARDFGLFGINLNAVSTGALVSGNFDYLRFSRSSGEVQLTAQQDMELSYGLLYPDVTQLQGLEISLTLPHVNWYGAGVALTDYGTVTTKQYPGFLQTSVIPAIHASGGLVSYNHPYGASSSPAFSQALQNQKMTSLAISMLGNRALGVDILEVGYPLRGGADLQHHIGLWDICSRNALCLTGNGASDDHVGTNWLRFGNNWFTSVWAASTAESDLLSALVAGRSWCASLPWFRGSLDLLVDGVAPMGSVTVSSLPTRQLSVIATDLPTNGTLQVVQGVVDYAGSSAAVPNTAVVATYSTADLSGGTVTLPVDTTQSSFVRTQVVDSAGTIVALSNPAWLLGEAPPNGIPAPRAY